MVRARNLDRIDHHSHSGTWVLLRRQPPAPLAPYVRELQGYFEKGGTSIVRKELPTSMIPLILVLGPGFTLHDPDACSGPRALDRSFVAGLHQTPTFVGSRGQAECMQINLTLAGARRFLGLDMNEIAGQVVDLHAILGRAAQELENRLMDSSDWEIRFERVEQILCDRILGARTQDRRVSAALAAIEGSAGGVQIGQLVRALGCSRKHLAALFRREVGVPPKSLARVLRFERAMGRIQAGAFNSLTELAAACGYADQAHFNRDFRAFAGESPTSLAARMLPDGTGILADSG